VPGCWKIASNILQRCLTTCWNIGSNLHTKDICFGNNAANTNTQHVAICLSKNPILHSRAKHIEIKHHFLRDYVQRGILDIQFIDTEHQWADIFSKSLTVERFDFIKKNLNIYFVSD